MRKSGKALKTLNERTALRWFLFAFRLCKPQVLEELAMEGAACFSGEGDADFQRWYTKWTDCHLLPATELMREETRDTLVYGYLDSPERRWHFEPPPRLSEAEKRIAAYTREWRAVTGQPTIPVDPGFPPFPLYASHSELSEYKRKCLERTRDLLSELERTRALLRNLAEEQIQPEDVWILLPASGESLSPKRPVRMLVRDLVYLAMKQAGATYPEIPQKFAAVLQDHVPKEFLDEHMAPERYSGLPKAVRSAAKFIGMTRLFRGKPGPRPSA